MTACRSPGRTLLPASPTMSWPTARPSRSPGPGPCSASSAPRPACVTARVLPVTALEQEPGSRLVALGAEQLEAQGVGKPVGRVERGADRQRVLDLLA